ncbi:MAG: radical SAM protein [Clostridia bacterium]|nr:radical SAM protein [Clostridia bacterium]
MKILGTYKNGNYSVCLLSDGSKIRYNDLDSLIPEKPESMDIKITNCCDMGCAMCHEDSSPDGEHGDIMNLPFLDTLLPYTELAIGGGNPLKHPELSNFLISLAERKLIANMTVNQAHFMGSLSRIDALVSLKLIYGIGVSVTKVDDELVAALRRYPNAVVHVINGVIDPEELKKLYGCGLKLLILGYKQFRRGETYYSSAVQERMDKMSSLLPEILESFEVVSFDNLALRQLPVRDQMTEEEWNQFYMGDDGKFTMYVDAVKREFAKSSTSTERFALLDDVKEMFEAVRR